MDMDIKTLFGLMKAGYLPNAALRMQRDSAHSKYTRKQVDAKARRKAQKAAKQARKAQRGR